MSKPIEILNNGEIQKLLDFVAPRSSQPQTQALDARNYAMILLMLDAGLRVGELVKLLNSDLFINSEPVKSIIVRPEIAKNHQERQIPTSIRLVEALYSLQRHYTTHLNESPTRPVFFTRNSQLQMSVRQVQRIIQSVCQKAIGRQIHPHILRHTFGTRMMRVTSTPVVQMLLGHKHLSSTEKYTHPNSIDLQDAINKSQNLTGI